MNKHISRFGLAAIVLSYTLVASAQIVDLEPQLKSLPKLEKRPASEVHLFGTKMAVNVLVDAKGNVTAVNSVNGPGWVCPNIDLPDVTVLREAAKAVAMKAKFEPAIVSGRNTESKSVVEIEFPIQSSKVKLSGVAVMGKRDADSSEDVKVEQPTTLHSLGHGSIGSNATLPKPIYPSAARAVRATGTVFVQVLIGENGELLSAEPIDGHPLLRTAARNAACGAKFAPTLLSGKPVRVSGVIKYNFVP